MSEDENTNGAMDTNENSDSNENSVSLHVDFFHVVKSYETKGFHEARVYCLAVVCCHSFSSHSVVHSA